MTYDVFGGTLNPAQSNPYTVALGSSSMSNHIFAVTGHVEVVGF